MEHPFDPKRTALLTIDLQNDFLHEDGAYGRAGQGADSITALPARIAPCATPCAPQAAPISRRSSRWSPVPVASR